MLSLLAAERVERYREARGLGDSLGFYAAGVVAFLSLAATMSLREAWLTVALSIQLPMLAWIHQRIAVRFQYECHDRDGRWWRSYGNELWEFDPDGLMKRREASINDVPIAAADRRIFGPRPEPERGRSFPLR